MSEATKAAQHHQGDQESLKPSVRPQVRQEVVQKCRTKLLELKTDLLNRFKNLSFQIQNHDRIQGDEMDMSLALQQQDQLLINQDRVRQKMLEVEVALAKIEQGVFGICEVTEEPIEEPRLLSIPYTRHSIEGAELMEASSRRRLGP